MHWKVVKQAKHGMSMVARELVKARENVEASGMFNHVKIWANLVNIRSHGEDLHVV